MPRIISIIPLLFIHLSCNLVWQQLLILIRRHVIVEFWQYVAEILVWGYAQQVARSDKGEVHGCVSGRVVAVDEEPVASSEREGPDAPLHRGVVYLIVALLTIPAQSVPSLKGIVACLGQGALRRVDVFVLLQHEPDETEYGHGLLLPLAADLIMVGLGELEVGLELVERGDVSEDLSRLG